MMKHSHSIGSKVSGKVGAVMHEFKAGHLHSGSKHGPIVTSRRQATAIGLAEARKRYGSKAVPRRAKSGKGKTSSGGKRGHGGRKK